MAKWEDAPVVDLTAVSEGPKWADAPVVQTTTKWADAPIVHQGLSGLSETDRLKALDDMQSQQATIGMFNRGWEPDQMKQAPSIRPTEPPKRTFGEAVKENLSPLGVAKNTPGIGAIALTGEALQVYNAALRLKENPDKDYKITESQPSVYRGPTPSMPISTTYTRQQDEQLVNEFMRKQTQQSTIPAKVVDIVSQLPGYAAEFAATGGAGSVVRKGTEKAASKYITSQMKKGLARTLAQKITRVAVPSVAAGATQATLMPQRTMATLAQKEAMQAVGLEEQNTPVKNILRSYLDTVIQATSERAGADIFPGLGKSVTNTLEKLPFGGKLISVMRNEWGKLTGQPAAQFMQRIATKGGFNGVLEEMGEERLATILTGLVGNNDFGAGKDANPLERVTAGLVQDLENMPAEFLAFSVVPGGQAALGYLSRSGGGEIDTLEQPVQPVPSTPADTMDTLERPLEGPRNATPEQMQGITDLFGARKRATDPGIVQGLDALQATNRGQVQEPKNATPEQIRGIVDALNTEIVKDKPDLDLIQRLDDVLAGKVPVRAAYSQTEYEAALERLNQKKGKPDETEVQREEEAPEITPDIVAEPTTQEAVADQNADVPSGQPSSVLKERQPWEMTFQETVKAEESRLRKDYPEVDDEDIQYQLKSVKVQDWLDVLKKRAEEGFQLSNDVLDDVVSRVGIQGLQRTFRGVAEQRQYVPKIQREFGGFKQIEKNVLDKEIWERTKAEHRNAVFGGMTRKVNPNEYIQEAAKHKAQVQKAISEGKSVPAEVLAEYPDLTISTGKESDIQPVRSKALETRIKNAIDEELSDPKKRERFEAESPEEQARMKQKVADFWTANYNRVVDMVKNKDAKLVSYLHAGNPFSRKVFTELTGIKLPGTKKATEEAVTDFVGRDKVEAAKAEKEAAKAKEKEDQLQEKLNREGEKKIRRDGKIYTWDELLTESVSEGWSPVIVKGKGPIPVYKMVKGDVSYTLDNKLLYELAVRKSGAKKSDPLTQPKASEEAAKPETNEPQKQESDKYADIRRKAQIPDNWTITGDAKNGYTAASPVEDGEQVISVISPDGVTKTVSLSEPAEEVEQEPSDEEQVQRAKEDAAGKSLVDFLYQAQTDFNRVYWGDSEIYTYPDGYFPTQQDLAKLHAELQTEVKQSKDKTAEIDFNRPVEVKPAVTAQKSAPKKTSTIADIRDAVNKKAGNTTEDYNKYLGNLVEVLRSFLPEDINKQLTAESGYKYEDFTDAENKAIEEEALKETAVFLFHYPGITAVREGVTDQQQADRIIGEYEGKLFVARRKAFAGMLQNKLEKELQDVGFTKEEAETHGSSLWSRIVNKYYTKHDANKAFEAEKQDAINAVETARKNKKLNDEVAARKRAKREALPYKIKEDLPIWKPSKNPENAVQEVEAVLKRPLNEDEKYVLIRGKYAADKIAGHIKDGKIGDDFLWMIKLSKFDKKVKTKVEEYLSAEYGSLRITSKYTRIKPILNKVKGYLDILKVFAAKDSTRYALNGYFIGKNKDVVATNGRVMIRIPNGSDVLYKGESDVVYDFAGDKISGNFPKYEQIIPVPIHQGTDSNYLGEMNDTTANAIVNVLQNSIVDYGEPTYPARLSEGLYVNPHYLEDSLVSLLSLGSVGIRMYQQGDRPLLLVGKDAKGNKVADVIIMPIEPGASGGTIDNALDLRGDLGFKPAVSANTVFTEEAKNAAQTRQKMRKNEAKIAGKNKGMAAVFTPAEIKDAVIILGYHAERGLRSVAAWTAKAVEIYGEDIRPHLKTIWDDIRTKIPSLGEFEPTPPKTPEPEPSSTMSNKNEIVEERRQERGLPPLEERAVQSNQDTLDKARRALAADPTADIQLIEELKNRPRPVTVEEEALILWRLNELNKQVESLHQKLKGTRDSEGQALIRQMIVDHISEFHTVSDINTAVGTDAARVLQFRTRLVDQNYNLINMLDRMQTARGEKLSREEMRQITDLQTQLAEANEKLKAALAREQTQEEKIRELEAKQFVEESKTTTAPRRLAYGRSNRLVTQERYEAAKKELSALLASTQVNTGINPQILAKMAEIGLYHLEAIGRSVTYDLWAGRMRSDLGDKVRPHLQDLWKEVNTTVLDEDKRAILDGMREAVQDEDKEKLGRLVKRLAQNIVAGGKEDLKNVVETVFNETRGIADELTELDILHTMADYGVYREKTSNELRQTINELKKQATRVSKLLDIADGKTPPAKKWGVIDQSDAVKQLDDWITAARKKYGIDPLTPEQRQMMADKVRQTRLAKEIDSLDSQIKARQRDTTRQKIVPNYSQETEDLQKVRDAKKAEYEKLFDVAEERRQQEIQRKIKATQKSLDDYEKRIKAKDLVVRRRQPGATSPELEALRQQRDAARAELMRLRQEAKPKKSPYDKVLDRINKRIADYEDRINRGDFSKKAKKPPLISSTIIARQTVVNRLKKQYDEMYHDALLEKMPLLTKGYMILLNFPGIVKSMMTGGEVSSIMRQLQPTAYVDAKTYIAAVKKTLEAYRDPEYAVQIETETESNPKYYAALKYANIQFSQVGSMSKEEFIPSRIQEKIPILGNLYRRGSAAFAAPLNWVRVQLFDVLTDLYYKQGQLSTDYAISPTEEDIRTMERIGKWINDLTMRSSFGKSPTVKKALTALNYVMFAPRYTLAKMNLVNTAFGMARSVLPTIEKVKDAHGVEHLTIHNQFDRILLRQSAQALVKFVAVQTLIAMAAYWTDPDDNENIFNPLSADFFKVRDGNERYDFTAGLGAMVRLLAQLATGKRLTAAGRYQEEERGTLLGRFLRSKEAPIVNLAVSLYTGKDFVGTPISPQKALWDSFTMLFLNDAVDAYKNSGVMDALKVLGAGAVGIGVQSYPEKAYTTRQKLEDDLAKQKYGKSWESLTPQEVRSIQNTPEYKAIDLKVQQERDEKPFEYKQPKALFDAGVEIFESLPQTDREVLLAAGVKTIGISDSVAGLKLNDARLRAYIDEVKAIMREQSGKFKHDNPEQTRDQINAIKKQARGRIISKIVKGVL